MSQRVRLGAFVLLTLSVLGVLVFLVGGMESKFQSNYRLQAQFQNVSGLEEGADVRVGGLRKGTVRRIELPSDPGGKVTVIMDLARETQRVVKRDSLASIKSEGLVGNKYLEVSFGSAGAQPIRGGDTIESQPPVDISDVIEKASQILNSSSDAIDNIQSVTAKINSGRGTVGALINDQSVYQEASAGVSALRQDADALKHNFLLRGYFNKRGFADSPDIRKHTLAQIPREPPRKAFRYQAKELFDKPDSAGLSHDKTLDEAGKYLEAQSPGLAVIAASAGPKGEQEQDRELSQARAYAVRSYLLEHFKLDDRHLKIIGLGKSEDDAKLQILIY